VRELQPERFCQYVILERELKARYADFDAFMHALVLVLAFDFVHVLVVVFVLALAMVDALVRAG
jgi:hypothetical protein